MNNNFCTKKDKLPVSWQSWHKMRSVLYLMPLGLSMIQSQSAERRAHGVKEKNDPVGASSACDATYDLHLSYRKNDIASTYFPKPLCALRFASSSLTLNGSLSKIVVYHKYTLFYSKVRIRE